MTCTTRDVSVSVTYPHDPDQEEGVEAQDQEDGGNDDGLEVVLDHEGTAVAADVELHVVARVQLGRGWQLSQVTRLGPPQGHPGGRGGLGLHK